MGEKPECRWEGGRSCRGKRRRG